MEVLKRNKNYINWNDSNILTTDYSKGLIHEIENGNNFLKDMPLL